MGTVSRLNLQNVHDQRRIGGYRDALDRAQAEIRRLRRTLAWQTVAFIAVLVLIAL